MTTASLSRASWRIGSMSSGYPKRWTHDDGPRGRRQRRRDLRRRPATPVAGSTSQNTTRAPASRTTFAVAGKVYAGTTTSSPGPSTGGEDGQVERRRAAGHGDGVLRLARGREVRLEPATSGPIVRKPPASTAATPASSASPSIGCAKRTFTRRPAGCDTTRRSAPDRRRDRPRAPSPAPHGPCRCSGS